MNVTDRSKKKGSYTLRGDGAVFSIEAADERGLWNGVYGFLRRVCGVEVYSADVISVPENAGFTLPTEYEYRYEPLLEYADTDWASGNDLTFAVANGLNGSRSGIDRPYGRPVNYLGFCHTLGAGLVPYWEYFNSHPEYYALTEHAGDRDGHLYNRASMLKVLHNVTKKDVKTIDALWETAIDKCGAANDTAAADRVRRSQLSWQYYKACNGLGEFRHGLNISRWTQANLALFDDLILSGATSYDEGKPMPEKINPLLYPLAWVDAEGMVLTIDMYLIPAIAALALFISVTALIKKKYLLLLANIAALCGVFASTWLVDLQQLGLAAEASVLLAVIAGTLIPLAVYGYSRKRGMNAGKGVIGAVAACVLAGAFLKKRGKIA
ncbi:MAG: hypothetical protein K6C36_04300 [Clostridia bacterium]|nr:hypothetical protein [Clostridia bacterium]